MAAKKAFNKTRAEMKKEEDSLAAVSDFMTEDDIDTNTAEPTVAEEAPKKPAKKTAKEPEAKTKKKETSVKSQEKEPEPKKEASKTESDPEPAVKEEKVKLAKKTTIDVPGGVYIPPLTVRSHDDKFSVTTILRLTEGTNENIKELAGKIKRSYNHVINMILEAYFDALEENNE